MRAIGGWLRLLAGLLCLGAALAVVQRAGLPQLADYRRLSGAPAAVAPAVGYLAPDFHLRTPAGKLVSLADDKVAFTLLYFWATTCAPCQREMRELNDLSASQPKLRILAVNMGESAAVARAWSRALSLRYDVLLDPSGHVARLYQIRGLPTSLLINGSGRILRLAFGSVGARQWQRELARYAAGG